MAENLAPLSLDRVNDQVCRVLDAHGQHVGNLKWISPLWKFKAIGYDPQGEVIPGGGPLTQRHNTTFAALDDAEVSARLTAA